MAVVNFCWAWWVLSLETNEDGLEQNETKIIGEVLFSSVYLVLLFTFGVKLNKGNGTGPILWSTNDEVA